jgi:plasmid stabilization system protein ParE
MRIQRAIDTLASMPRLGRPRSYLASGLLAFPVKSWLIVYERMAGDEGIRVHRILDGHRDLAALFDGDS